jgi:hypothetical protein
MADDWKVHEHQPIQRLAENLWRVSGSLPRMSLRRTMTLARLGDGRIVIHSAIALDEPSMSAIESWGRPAILIVPNGFHRLDAAAYKKRYPGLRVLAPRGARPKVEQVLAVDGTCDDFPADDSVRIEPLAGIGDAEAVLVVRSTDGVTLVFADCVFNMDKKRDPLGWFFTTLLGSAPGPRISRLFRMVAVKDRAALKADLERLAALPGLMRVIVAHEKLASGGDAPATLRQAATFL